jgi:tripartite-type tricarboxylate transporter receptor subunit TctC
MPHCRPSIVAFAFAAGFSWLTSTGATAAWPDRPVTIVAPSTPGDAPDVIARALAQRLGESLGQPVVVENKPGAGGVVGSEYAAHRPADGYTLIMGNAGSHGINAALYAKLAYDPVKDFAPVALVSTAPNLMVVTPSLPVSTVAEFIAYAKANPGKIAYASGGNGSSAHLSAELFKMMTGIEITHVPYKGATPAITDVMAGNAQVFIGNLPPILPQVKAGRLRPLGVTTLARSPELPDVPTIAEAGVPGYETVAWFGVFAPAATPKEIVQALAGAIQRAARDGDMRKRLHEQGAEPVGSTPEQFAAFMRAEIARWTEVVKVSGAKAD